MAESRSQDIDHDTLEKLEYVLKGRNDDYAKLIYFMWSLEKEAFNEFQSIVKSHKKDSEGLKMFVESMVENSKSGVRQCKEDVSRRVQNDAKAADSHGSDQGNSSKNKVNPFFMTIFFFALHDRIGKIVSYFSDIILSILMKIVEVIYNFVAGSDSRLMEDNDQADSFTAEGDFRLLDHDALEKLEYVLAGRDDDYANLMYFTHSLGEKQFNLFQRVLKSHKIDSKGLKMFVESEVKKSKSESRQYKEEASWKMQPEVMKDTELPTKEQAWLSKETAMDEAKTRFEFKNTHPAVQLKIEKGVEALNDSDQLPAIEVKSSPDRLAKGLESIGKNGFQVFLQDLNGRTSTVDVSSTMSIDLLKTKVPAMRAVAKDQIKLIHQGHSLINGTMKSNHIKPGDTIQLQVRCRGGTRASGPLEGYSN